jgi:hypothetical protein
MPIDPLLSLNFPNSAPAPTPGYDEGLEGGLPDNESAEYGAPAGPLSPTDAMGASAGSPEALLQTLLQMTGGNPSTLASLLMQVLSLLSAQGLGPAAPPAPGPASQPQPPMF